MKRIVYMNGGAICVVIPVINTHPEPEDITEDEAVARAMLRLPATATDIRVLPETAIPASREFRSSWVYNTDKTAVIENPAAVSLVQAEATRIAELASQADNPMTKAQIDNYIEATATNLAGVRTVLKKLAYRLNRLS